jgi:Xaa-Pro dipeptidase
MTTTTRRDFVRLTATGAGAAVMGGVAGCAAGDGSDLPDPIRRLQTYPGEPTPISEEERAGRIAKAQRLMVDNSIDAIFLDAGTSMFYYTGVRWGQSERMFGIVIPARGALGIVTPAFEEERARELIKFGDDVRPWQEHESPYELVAGILRDRGVRAGTVGMEERVRFFLFDGIRKEMPGTRFVSADLVTIGCRVIKSAAELALMQRANDITVAAYKAAIATLYEGMLREEFSSNAAAAHERLGASGGIGAQFGEASAYPHGSSKPQALREGDIVLMDGGCSVDGYRSDISRTIVFGEPTQRQRDVWDLELQAQDAALAAAGPGVPCEDVDAAARQVIVDGGFGPGYRYFTHRVGHGIGLDGHEWINLVRGNKTPMQPGMCFSNEPGIYIYGEFGVRLEDDMYVTEDGANLFTEQSPSIGQPFAS